MVKKERDSQAYKPKNGDRIICEHKGLKYEAKVLDSRKDDKNSEMQFLVHYQGWNKNWDEWVGESRVHQFNEANLGLIKEQRTGPSKAKSAGSARKKSSAGPTNEKASISSSSIQGDTKDVTITLDQDDNVLPDKEVKIKLPEELENWLVDDDNSIKNKKLTVLPARSTISMILKDFVNHKKITTKTPADKEAILNELTLGIKDYFNVMLGSHLLYRFERLQYQNLLKDEGKDVDLTNHYGVIHLVRLMTKIGKPLAATTLDPTNIQTLLSYIQELLKFISKQANLFDLERNYILAPPEYIKNALK